MDYPCQETPSHVDVSRTSRYLRTKAYNPPGGHGLLSSMLTEVRTVRMPSCNWCGRMILPREGAVKFPCPQCGETTIWRCEKCRGFGRPYKCQKCGFSGP